MAGAFRALSPAPLRLALPLTTAVLFTPLALGLLGTLLPALGWLPPIGAEDLSLRSWRMLAGTPGLARAVVLTLERLAATLLAFAAALAITASAERRGAGYFLILLVPGLLAVPHLGSAIGFGFLAAPSGLLARLVSPWLTGWVRPPDLATVNDPQGFSLTLGLALREAPFLLFAIQVATGQVGAARQLQAARSLGYGPAEAWVRVLLPQILPLLQLPLLAVLAFALSVVDMALVLGPTAPPPLAIVILRLGQEPDLVHWLPAAAGAVLLLFLTLAAGLLLHAGMLAAARFARSWPGTGPRPWPWPWPWLERALQVTGEVSAVLVLGLSLGALASLALWSLAGAWRFPAALPHELSLEAWRRAVFGLSGPALRSVLLGALSTGLALLLSLACLEQESRRAGQPTVRLLRLVYLPLVIPQISFLFGLQVALLAAHLDGSWLALVWTHLLFVMPYTFLMLRAPFLALDPNYVATGRMLGRGQTTLFWRIKLPLLRRPVAAAAALGFTVSLALYLPTLYAGGGRFTTLTTETLAIAGSSDRRLAAAAGLVLALLPFLALAAAALVRAPPGLRIGAGNRSPG